MTNIPIDEVFRVQVKSRSIRSAISAKQFPVEVAETGCRSFAAVWFSPSSSSNFYSRQLEYYYGSRFCVQSNCPRAVFSIIPRCGQVYLKFSRFVKRLIAVHLCCSVFLLSLLILCLINLLRNAPKKNTITVPSLIPQKTCAFDLCHGEIRAGLSGSFTLFLIAFFGCLCGRPYSCAFLAVFLILYFPCFWGLTFNS